MVRLVLYSTKKKENDQITASVRSYAAKIDDQSWECSSYQKPALAADKLRKGCVDLISWDVSQREDRAAIASVRWNCRESFLLVVAEPETSPLSFLNPSISPNSLILRPFTKKELQRVSAEMADDVRRKREGVDDEELMTIFRRDGQRIVRYSEIYYFESRGKKLYARLRNEEIGFAGTLEKLESTLPKQFKRCHRSFIVNTARIERAMISKQLIYLWDGLLVPVSRSFKKAFKEELNGRL